MNRKLFLLPFFFLAGMLYGQAGLTVYYQIQDATYWKVIHPDNSDVGLLEQAPAFALDYHFRPFEGKRIELFPELRMVMPTETTFGQNKTTLGLYSFNLNTNLYPLTFNGDCHCPTFRKENPFFKKGFFLRLSPGLSILRESVFDGTLTLKATQTVFSLGIGGGLDIGISPRLTVTPLFMVRFYPKYDLKGLPRTYPDLWFFEKKTSIFTQFNPGIRLEFQFIEDY